MVASVLKKNGTPIGEITQMTKFSVFSATHIGMVRPKNQDHSFSWELNPPGGPPLGLVVVADGMGGHKYGEVASEIAIETVSKALVPLMRGEWSKSPASQEEIGRAFQIAVERANGAIFRFAKGMNVQGNMGTTLSGALVQGELGVTANVGDSRVYLLSDSEMAQLTVDHSLIGELVANGYYDEAEIYTHPKRGVLSRAMGTAEEVKVDIDTFSLENGSRLMACSDGLWGSVKDDDEVARIFKEASTPEKAVEALIEAANEHGGRDNIAVAVLEAGKGWGLKGLRKRGRKT